MSAEFNQAKSDVRKAGGQVTEELKYGLKGLIVRLPKDAVSAFEKKDYVDFMEKDSPGNVILYTRCAFTLTDNAAFLLQCTLCKRLTRDVIKKALHQYGHLIAEQYQASLTECSL